MCNSEIEIHLRVALGGHERALGHVQEEDPERWRLQRMVAPEHYYSRLAAYSVRIYIFI